jgi:hypothetical protein
MSRTSERDATAGTPRLQGVAPGASQGLEWMWRHLQDVRQPRILDCGPISQTTLEILVRRGAKFYASDLITPALENDPRFWDRSKKAPVFLATEFLNQIPEIPPGSITAVLSWNLLDFVPPESLSIIVEKFFSLLQPYGVLFCILREPRVAAGVERRWWLEALTVAHSQTDAKRVFSNPPITNREVERLLPAASIKTFLTRSGRREVLAMRPAS